MAAYTDLYYQSLTTSHLMSSRAEVYYGGAKVLDLELVGGAVDADRTAQARRTATIVVDGRFIPNVTGTNQLAPFGSELRVYRTVHFADGTSSETRLFWGRIESVSLNGNEITVTAADRAVWLSDWRLGKAKTYKKGSQIKAAVLDLMTAGGVDPANIYFKGTFPSIALSAPFVVEEDRVEALNSLCSQVGWQWYANMAGQFWLTALPGAIRSTTPIVWTVDAGATGVLIARGAVQERTGIANWIICKGEVVTKIKNKPDKRTPIYGQWQDTTPSSPTYISGAFGKVVRVFAGKQLASNADCATMAKQIGRMLTTQVHAITVECVPNQRLGLEEVIQVSGSQGYDGKYFVTGFTMPLVPDTPMRLTAAKVIIDDTLPEDFLTVGEAETLLEGDDG
jgi:hypothetical protein